MALTYDDTVRGMKAGASTATSSPTDQRDRDGGISLWLLVASLTVGHTVASLALMALPALAPAVAGYYRIDASLIGYQFGIVGATMLASLMLFGNLSRKLGGCRTNQCGHGLVAIGMLVMVLPSVAFILLGSIAIGLGFGLLTPSHSYLMTRFSPPEKRNLVFSIQQTSVPLGGIAAGLVAPLIAVTLGWRWSLAFCSCLLLAVIAILQLGRSRWDNDRVSATPAIAKNLFAGVVANWQNRRLRHLSIAGGAFCWAQFCVAGYTVVASVEFLGMDLITAGTVLMAVNLCNAVGRMVAGWLADRIGGAPRVLRWTAWTMLASCLSSLLLAPAWHLVAIYLLFSLLGITSGAWPGILLAEVGHLAPRAQVSQVLSGTLVILNIGKFVGPMVFAATYGVTKSYPIAFALIGVPAIAAIYSLSAAQDIREGVLSRRSAPGK